MLPIIAVLVEGLTLASAQAQSAAPAQTMGPVASATLCLQQRINEKELWQLADLTKVAGFVAYDVSEKPTPVMAAARMNVPRAVAEFGAVECEFMGHSGPSIAKASELMVSAATTLAAWDSAGIPADVFTPVIEDVARLSSEELQWLLTPSTFAAAKSTYLIMAEIEQLAGDPAKVDLAIHLTAKARLQVLQANR